MVLSWMASMMDPLKRDTSFDLFGGLLEKRARRSLPFKFPSKRLQQSPLPKQSFLGICVQVQAISRQILTFLPRHELLPLSDHSALGRRGQQQGIL